MFLVFYSNRRGYDDAVDDRHQRRTTQSPHGTWTRYDDPPT